MKSTQTNPNVDQTRRPRTAYQKKLGAVSGPGRPTDLPGRPTWLVGPTTFSQLCGNLPLAPYIGLLWKSYRNTVAPSYKYKGGGKE